MITHDLEGRADIPHVSERQDPRTGRHDPRLRRAAPPGAGGPDPSPVVSTAMCTTGGGTVDQARQVLVASLRDFLIGTHQQREERR